MNLALPHNRSAAAGGIWAAPQGVGVGGRTLGEGVEEGTRDSCAPQNGYACPSRSASDGPTLPHLHMRGHGKLIETKQW